MVDIRQSPEYADYLSQIGWRVKRTDNTNYFIKKFPIVGSVLKVQRPEKIDFKEIEKLRRKYGAFQILIEPKLSSDAIPAHLNSVYQKGSILTSGDSTPHIDQLYAHGFKLSKSPYLPTKSLLIDLTISKEKLLDNLKKDARYAVKKEAANKPKATADIKKFRNAWKGAVGAKRYIPPLSHLITLKKSFGKNSLFLLSGDDSSGAIFLIADKSAYYWQAFTNKNGRKEKTQYKIVWGGILWAKKQGAKIFDFEGIYDGRFPNKSWLGFTHFKKSFGGDEIVFPGCFIKTVLPFKK